MGCWTGPRTLAARAPIVAQKAQFDPDQPKPTTKWQQIVAHDVLRRMSPPNPHSQATQSDNHHVVYRPRESDGVGNALRQIFTGAPSLPSDLASLLRRLSKDN
jgi:hypothetical protein